MKFLLTAINAKYIHSNLAVYSLKACAKEYKDAVEIGEFTINNQKDYILEQIYKKKPDVLFFSCYIWNIDYVEEIASEYHKICPDTPIWVGGPEVSYEVAAFLEKNSAITGAMIAEGEITFYELLDAYAKQGEKAGNVAFSKELEVALKQIDGLAFRGTEGVCMTQERDIMDLSQIPFCYNRMEDFSNRIIYYESSRGCPFSCSYCLSSIDKKLRFRDLRLVKEELQFFIDQKVPQIKFVDRTFNCNHEHAMEIWRFVKAHDNGVTNFHFEISADLLNEEELALISDMRPGLIQLEIGVQSTNEVTIQEIHRTMKLERLKETVRAIQKGGNIHEHLDLIAGLPYEDYQRFQKSFDDIYELKPNQLQLGFLKVLKGSYMYEHREEYGIVYHTNPPYEVLKTNWLSYEDVLRIKQVEEMLEVYYNSGQFEITMKVLEPLFDSAFLMFQSLGAFYEERGYFGMSHSRNKRAEIILSYMEDSYEWGKQDQLGKTYEKANTMMMLREALTFDLYYRENCKSRPTWAMDQSLWKEQTRRFCANGKLSHIEPFHYVFPDKQVKTLKVLPAYQEEPVWALFHYDDRDPLDHQARVEYVSVNEKDVE